MRTALFLILAALALFSTLFFLISSAPKAKAQTQTIRVTAYVDEQIGFVKKDGRITISTNLGSGLYLQSENYRLFFPQAGEAIAEQVESFFLSANF